MIDENDVYRIYDKFGIKDTNSVIEEFNKIIKDDSVSSVIKSKAYCGIGDVIAFLEPELHDDCGYEYYKKALEYDEDNLDARVGICVIFDQYPAPKYNVITEEEYLEHLQILINKFDKITDENKRSNIIQLMKNLVEYRLKMISQ